uniref:Uncharacterized protein n=1 Tax=Meloidogyne enterolobii TaxID=390850 RepID=A0A6V7XDI1_MELEN|nr:unnamed protein product [Meloidogyne enterolobii]
MFNLKYFLYLILFVFLFQITKCQGQGAGRWIGKNEIEGSSSVDGGKKLVDSPLNVETLDNIVSPYAIGWSPENEWTMDPIRLKKWSTQLRYGKRAVSAFRRSPWSSQVRFG